MASLFDNARTGDMDAFAELFEPLRAKVYAVAYRVAGPDLAEDVVMDTFLQAWRALPQLKRAGALSSWICQIARNRSLDMLRRQNRLVTLEMPQENGPPRQREIADESKRPDDELTRKDDLQAVKRAMQRLPEKHRAVLELRHIDGLSYAEIAAATGVSIGTVMSRLFHARKKLRSAFDAESFATEPAAQIERGEA